MTRLGPMGSITIPDRVHELIECHGSLSAVARLLKIDKGYLSRLHDGAKVNPSADVLDKLGLKRSVLYFKKAVTSYVKYGPTLEQKQDLPAPFAAKDEAK